VGDAIVAGVTLGDGTRARRCPYAMEHGWMRPAGQPVGRQGVLGVDYTDGRDRSASESWQV
jgi:hypothetical protein